MNSLTSDHRGTAATQLRAALNAHDAMTKQSLASLEAVVKDAHQAEAKLGQARSKATAAAGATQNPKR
jgi:ferritin-like metal-binding protein YciE